MEILEEYNSIILDNNRIDTEYFSLKIGDAIGEDFKLGWEIGPDIKDESVTTLSLSILGNSRKSMKILEELDLPILEKNKKIQIGIPPKKWDLFFNFSDEQGRNYEIDASKWSFTISNYFKKVSIILCSDIFIPSEIENEISMTLLVGEIGEMNILRYIKSIDMVFNKNSYNKNFVNFTKFRTSFVSNFPDCYYSEFFRDSITR